MASALVASILLAGSFQNIFGTKNMIERRQDKRVAVDFWASLKHPLLGTVTCGIQDMSVSGIALELDEELNFFVMMELDIRIHGEGWDNSMPALPVQVVRVKEREIALRFLDSVEDAWVPPDDDLGPGSNESNVDDIEEARRLSKKPH